MRVNLTQEMKSILNDYTDEVMHAVIGVLEEVGEDAAVELRATSPKRTGRYAKSWDSTVDEKRTYTSVKVYNKKYYRLTHLLENGHAKRGGGRVEAVPHIASVNTDAHEQAQKKIMEAIERIQ